MKDSIVKASAPYAMVRETDARYEITLVRDVTSVKRVGVTIPWPVIILLVLLLVIAIAAGCAQAADSAPSKMAIASSGSSLASQLESSGLVFPHSDTIYLTDDDLTQLRQMNTYSYAKMLRYAVNEIYARHNYQFRESEYTLFYGRFDWYCGYLSAEEAAAQLNDVERYNLHFLLGAETAASE